MGGNAGKSPRQGTGWGVDERHKGGLQVRIPWNPGVTDLKQAKHEFGKRAPGSGGELHSEGGTSRQNGGHRHNTGSGADGRAL